LVAQDHLPSECVYALNASSKPWTICTRVEDTIDRYHHKQPADSALATNTHNRVSTKNTLEYIIQPTRIRRLHLAYKAISLREQPKLCDWQVQGRTLLGVASCAFPQALKDLVCVYFLRVLNAWYISLLRCLYANRLFKSRVYR
jgi:hypothetical protein